MLSYRSMHAIIQKRRNIIDKDFKCFYLKFFDPTYVKFEKIDILYKLADSNNFESVVNELKSYALTEYNIDIVEKAVKYLGNIGCKFEKSRDACIESLKEILQYNQDFTINQAVIVLLDFLRKYNDSRSKDLLNLLDDKFVKLVTRPESKAALLYIIGENNLLMKNSTELLSPFIENFNNFNEKVKLQVLNAIIKNYVNKPEETEDLAKIILQKAGEETDNPDVRDRAYIYWRLLEKDPDSARDMILGEKPTFEFKEENVLHENLVDDIILNITNISAIYHKYSNAMILKQDMIIEAEVENKIIDQKINKTDFDLLGLGEYSINVNIDKEATSNIFDIFGSEAKKDVTSDLEFFDDNKIVIFNEALGVNIPQPYMCFKQSDRGLNGTSGLVIHSLFHREGGRLLLGLHIQNITNVSLTNFDITIESNSFGICLGSNPQLSSFIVNPESSKVLIVNLDITKENSSNQPPSSPYNMNIIFKNNIDDFSFQAPFLLNVIFVETGKMTNQTFVEFFKKHSSTKVTHNYTIMQSDINDEILSKLFERNNIFAVAKNSKIDPPIHYYSSNAANLVPIILEITFTKSKKF